MEKKDRIWEIDFLRGIAFICMVYDHVMYDLNSIFGVRVHTIDLIGDFSAVLFMILCGISTTLSRNSLKRGMLVFGAAILLTVVTGAVDALFNTRLIIVFGILHLLGIAMILSYFIKKLPNVFIAIISVIIYILSIPFKQINDMGNYLFAFGIHDITFYSSDYYPLIPFLAFVFVGIIIGKLLYKDKTSLFPFSIGKNPLSFIGKHSLILYLIHQPIVLAITFLILKIMSVI
ncbi:MAG: DUF1624 domain-containing protein [Ruminococcaceae bacterium]|nr:DUF1624 domain-containing protein [Oscillospiraceae bacterium]